MHIYIVSSLARIYIVSGLARTYIYYPASHTHIYIFQSHTHIEFNLCSLITSRTLAGVSDQPYKQVYGGEWCKVLVMWGYNVRWVRHVFWVMGYHYVVFLFKSRAAVSRHHREAATTTPAGDSSVHGTPAGGV